MNLMTNKCDLSARRHVYVWADEVYLQARMEANTECMLVVIGATQRSGGPATLARRLRAVPS
jgi:hypothetical protein